MHKKEYMRKLELDENFTVVATDSQWILKYNRVGEINPKTGRNTITKEDYFHPTLRSALRSYVDKKLKADEPIEESIIRLSEQIDNVLKKLS